MKQRAKIPYILTSIFLLSLLLLLLSKISETLANGINRVICVRVRGMLSALTSPFPISIFELLVFFLPMAVILSVVYIVRAESQIRRRFFAVLSVISLLPTLYVFTLGISYNTTGIRLEYGAVENGDLISAAESLSHRIAGYKYVDSDIPSLKKMHAEFSKTYPKICHGYGLESVKLPKPKPLLTSSFMCRIGTLAFFSYPTAEVNINTDIPAYMLPFTVAHEYAHLLGAGSEAEANFLAYLACEASENSFIKYSGALSAIEYLLSDISKNDTEMYIKVYNNLAKNAKEDILRADKFFDGYEDGFLYRLADGLNSAHLEISDSHGKSSYSLFSRYVAHYLNSA